MSSRWLVTPLILAMLAAPQAAQSQDAPPAAAALAAGHDSVGGKWKSPGSSRYIVLDLVQSGDSLSGTAVMEKDGAPTDLQADIVGTVINGKVELLSKDGALRINGTLRKDVIRARVEPGRYKNAFVIGEVQFSRVR